MERATGMETAAMAAARSVAETESAQA